MESCLKNDLFRANKGFLELMINVAGSDAPPFKLASALAPMLLELKPEARLQVAQRPYALLTFRLHDATWWRSVEGGREKISDAGPRSASPERAATLARRVLTLAWNATTRGALKSSVSLGISPAVTEILSRLTLEQLERIADEHTMALGPRWPDGVKIWSRLLEAAKSGDPRNLDLVDRWAAQLMAGELMKNP